MQGMVRSMGVGTCGRMGVGMYGRMGVWEHSKTQKLAYLHTYILEEVWE